MEVAPFMLHIRLMVRVVIELVAIVDVEVGWRGMLVYVPMQVLWRMYGGRMKAFIRDLLKVGRAILFEVNWSGIRDIKGVDVVVSGVDNILTIVAHVCALVPKREVLFVIKVEVRSFALWVLVHHLVLAGDTIIVALFAVGLPHSLLVVVDKSIAIVVLGMLVALFFISWVRDCMGEISISTILKVIRLVEVVDGKLQIGSSVRMVVRLVRLAVLVLVVSVRSICVVTLELAEVSTRSIAKRSLIINALRCVVIELILQGIAITLGKVSIGSEPDEGGLGMVAINGREDLVIIVVPIYFLDVAYGMLLVPRIMVGS